MDYSTVSEIQITRKDGIIEIYKGPGIEKFKKLVGGTRASEVIVQNSSLSKYAQSGISIKPMTGDIFEQAELLKNASGLKK